MTEDQARQTVFEATFRVMLRKEREAAYRRALAATGHTPGSVEVMVAKARHWIDTGTDKPEEKA